MGTQQILLIVVGLIIVGIMIAIGIFMFKDQAAATNRDSITNDLVQLAAQAQKYYRRPAVLGGGSGSFLNVTLQNLTSKPTNANGTYAISGTPTQQSVVITGSGLEIGNDGQNPVLVTMTVWSDSLLMVANN
jgi:Tfp pilus assembly protein PilE